MSAAFATGISPVNPGVNWPWVQNVSKMFLKYRIHSLRYTYIPTVATTITPGVVQMAFEFNPDAPVAKSLAAMVSYSATKSCRAYEAMTFNVPIKQGFNGIQWKRVRDGDVGIALISFDPGYMFLATYDGVPGPVGHLHVDYDIEFFDAHLYNPRTDNQISDTIIGSTSFLRNIPEISIPADNTDTKYIFPWGDGTPENTDAYALNQIGIVKVVSPDGLPAGWKSCLLLKPGIYTVDLTSAFATFDGETGNTAVTTYTLEQWTGTAWDVVYSLVNGLTAASNAAAQWLVTLEKATTVCLRVASYAVGTGLLTKFAAGGTNMQINMRSYGARRNTNTGPIIEEAV
jgi:hypothetical protein